jgi:hypothetical protein
MTWSLILSRYNFVVVYVPGKENERVDALSRRDQDLPVNADDKRLADRNIQLLKPEMLAKHPVVRAAPVRTGEVRLRSVTGELPAVNQVGELPDELTGWDTAIAEDQEYQEVRKAVKDGLRVMPKHLGLFFARRVTHPFSLVFVQIEI